MSEPLTDLYFSCDVETDGPVPGPYSLVSIGMSVVASFDGETFTRRDPREHTFYAKLKPISETWDPEALAISGFTREHLLDDGERAQDVFPRLAAWVRETSAGSKPVFVAYPLGFDWMFAYHYFNQYGGPTPGVIENSPFGFSSALDMKSLYAAKANAPVSRSSKRSMPKHLFGSAPHTHNALDDAIEQGELFCNLMEWGGTAA